MKRLLLSLAAAIALAAPSYAQVIQGLDGRWEGPGTLPSGATLRAVVRIETKAGKTTAVFESPDQGGFNIPATIARTGDTLTVNVPSIGVVYTAKISGDGKTLTGAIAQGGGSIPVTMVQKADTSGPLTGPAIAGLDGNWEGGLMTPGGTMDLVFRISTKDGKTTTLVDSTTESIKGIPALTARTGQRITITLRGIGANFTGDLSADGKTIAGTWSQSGNDLLLTLTKK